MNSRCWRVLSAVRVQDSHTKKMRGSKYQTQLVEEFASLVDVSQEDWLQQSLFNTNDAVRAAAHNTLRMETSLNSPVPLFYNRFSIQTKNGKMRMWIDL